MGNLAARMSKPLRIRLGGNAIDSPWYIPTLTTPLQVIGNMELFNTIRTTSVFSPTLRVLSTVFPDWFDSMAKVALYANGKLEDSLDALLPGNGPDLHNSHGLQPRYRIEHYIPKVETYLEN
ncbi:hypothetical protein CPC08DRAFT_771534 [Agrocybe pediades]|nr:hypothetical protein CPC08DRAFT_771534 [Agrocybe pediades]